MSKTMPTSANLEFRPRRRSDTLGHPHAFERADLEWAYAAFAKIVMRHGEIYLPWLDRLEREIAHFERTDRMIERARRTGGLT